MEALPNEAFTLPWLVCTAASVTLRPTSRFLTPGFIFTMKPVESNTVMQWSAIFVYLPGSLHVLQLPAKGPKMWPCDKLPTR